MIDFELDFDISMGDCTSGLLGDYSNPMEKQIEGETQDSESDESSM